MLRRFRCQVDLSFKIFGPPSAGIIGGPSEEGGEGVRRRAIAHGTPPQVSTCLSLAASEVRTGAGSSQTRMSPPEARSTSTVHSLVVRGGLCTACPCAGRAARGGGGRSVWVIGLWPLASAGPTYAGIFRGKCIVATVMLPRRWVRWWGRGPAEGERSRPPAQRGPRWMWMTRARRPTPTPSRPPLPRVQRRRAGGPPSSHSPQPRPPPSACGAPTLVCLSCSPGTYRAVGEGNSSHIAIRCGGGGLAHGLSHQGGRGLCGGDEMCVRIDNATRSLYACALPTCHFCPFQV